MDAVERVQEELRTLNTRFRIATEAAGIGVWDWDLETNALLWDDQMYEVYELRREDFAGAYEAWEATVVPEDLERCRATLEEVKLTEIPLDMTFRIRAPSGAIKYIAAFGRVIRSGDGSGRRMIGVNCDITRRKRAEMSLQQSESRLHATLNSITDGVIATDRDGRVLRMNPVAEQHTGWDLVEAIGRPVNQVFCSLDEATRKELPLPRVDGLSDEAVVESQRVLVSRNGAERFVELSVASIRNEDGDIHGRAFVWRDESETHRMERELRLLNQTLERRVIEQTSQLRSSERFLRTILDSLSVAVVALDDTGVIVAMNENWRSIPEGVAGNGSLKNGLNYFSILDREPTVGGRISEAIRNLIRNSQPNAILDFDWDASEETLRYRCKITRSRSPDRASVIVAIEDITKIRAAEFQFADLFEFAPEALVLSHPNGLIAMANQRAATMFQLPKEAMQGKEIRLLFAPLSRDLFDRKREERALSSASDPSWRERFEVTALREGGAEFPTEISLSKISTAEGILMAVAIHDVSVRKEAEKKNRQLEAQLRLAQKMQAIGTLAAGIAHDFNNILGALLSNAEMAQLEIDNPDAVNQSLENILTGVRRAKDLTRQILMFGSPSEQDRRPIRLGPLVQEAIRLMRPSVPANIEIHEEINPDCPLVFADATQIHQVIVNLGSNAYQAIGQRPGLIEINLRKVEIDAEFARAHTDLKEGVYACLSVQDDGAGMTQDTQDHIFDPFYTTKRNSQGSGLGLSVVHGIVASHHGAVAIYSDPGVGSAFHVYLPACNETKYTSNNSPGNKLLMGSGERILLVDDEVSLANAGKRILERLGYCVTAETNPEKALEIFKSEPKSFDLLITDYAMPNMNGLELAGLVGQNRPDLAVILTSGYIDKGITKLFQEEGDNPRAVLAKPATADEISQAVGNILSRTRSGSESD